MKIKNDTHTKANKIVFTVLAVLIIGASLFFSNKLVEKVSTEERHRMELWADATKQIAASEPGTDFSFCLRVIEDNYSIPVIITDEEGIPYQHRNVVPDSAEADLEYLTDKVKEYGQKNEPIPLKIDSEITHTLYYGDSDLLRQLSYFPIIQWLIILFFLSMLYMSIISAKKAEQDRVWVGLSKETAHQLGTPISSLIAWIELLRTQNIDQSMVDEMNKDVTRLQTVANRFSKVGSRPELSKCCLNECLDGVVTYMRNRLSSKVEMTCNYDEGRILFTLINQPLFEWVIENLCKNAADAMETGKGRIDIKAGESDKNIWITVKDTGKGIPKSKFKSVFKPGYTTKSRGWGLGLSLAKRIIEDYNKGHIFVENSEIGVGTTFRIELPKITE